MPITHLVAAQVRGEVTAAELVRCYPRRAEAIHAATNCFTCWVPEALDEAARCDRHLEESGGRPIGRLHGIPCTIKDHYAMKGLPVTMGLKTLKERMEKSGGARHDALAVLALREEGAIPIAKTNMTQYGETWGGGNPAFGDTLSPWNTLRTTGGSSSGEGASVGSSASVFGIGSDVGGSVRCPAAFCGVAGFKPTAQRFSFGWDDGRTILNHPGDYGILATGGPLAKHVGDLIEVLRACWSPTSPMLETDNRLPFMPFDDRILASTRPLTIGYHVTGGYTHPAPCPSTVRIVQQVVDLLGSKGHTMVPFDPAETVPVTDMHPVSMAMHGVGTGAEPETEAPAPKERDGSYSSKSTDTTVDEVHPDLAGMSSLASGPGELLPAPTSIKDYHGAIDMRDRLRDSMYRAWRREGLDVLIGPAWAFPAPPVEEVRNLGPAARTTSAWNFFDMPAGVVPAGNVTARDLESSWEIALDPPTVDAPFRDACLRSRDDSEGLPISVQVVGLPWREELVLHAMLQIERALAGAAAGSRMEHGQLAPVPRRSPSMGDQPVEIEPDQG